MCGLCQVKQVLVVVCVSGNQSSVCGVAKDKPGSAVCGCAV